MMIHLNAGHDKNGNPRRVYASYHPDGSLEGAWNEGYLGAHAVPDAFISEAAHAPTIPTTPAFYREILRQAASMDTEARIARAKARREALA